eukprot:CAMPEP_0194241398 /NCGR_PEP_ID=MMETSP0158-20130606/7275_1 /TAXON_ID=33649 /ORGANISM="Thalassionema nitzschioides, Strain L26-B" /LENGTH=125 /DNA_ID=CAMNT_0038976279 /DNA_START=491 /DNA_END=868 /DNA_ORIENTATION=+
MTVDRNSGNESGRFTKEELQDCFTLKEDHICVCKDKLGWPDYDGRSDDLVQEGCFDEPLLKVAKASSNILTYVRIVPQAQNRKCSKESDTALERGMLSKEEESMGDSEFEHGNDSSSEEECEFED